MKKFTLKRVMQYTETAEIEAECWDEAKMAFISSDANFIANNDDIIVDSSIEFTGDIDDQAS